MSDFDAHAWACALHARLRATRGQADRWVL